MDQSDVPGIDTLIRKFVAQPVLSQAPPGPEHLPVIRRLVDRRVCLARRAVEIVRYAVEYVYAYRADHMCRAGLDTLQVPAVATCVNSNKALFQYHATSEGFREPM